jgi:hypothetical protein
LAVYVKARLIASQTSNLSSPVVFDIEGGDTILVHLWSVGVGKLWGLSEWRVHVTPAAAAFGVLVLARSPFRWIPFGPVTPPTIRAFAAEGHRVPRAGYFHPGRDFRRMLLAVAPGDLRVEFVRNY